MDDLMQVKSQREYAAMLKEIDSVKAQISDHEEAVLTDMEEIEKLSEELKTHEEHINAEREAVAKERAEVESAAERATRQIETESAERSAVEAELPRDMIASIGRLERSRQGIFLTKAENATCQSCFVRVRPQVFQEIKLAQVVHTCDNCRRFLYYEPSLAEAPAEESAEAQAEQPAEAPAEKPVETPKDVGAIDGGAV
jgi:predicted  nucleic acid-binding Zn-ribbon protein